MVQSYKNNQDKALPAIEKQLQELKKLNPSAYETWQQIMDYWHYANTQMPINYDLLPVGLENTEKLCIVVLGYQLNSDGSLRDELVGRLQTALSAAEEYPDAIILCTGGGTASQNKSVTEAGEMAKWLIKNGIPKNRILIEDRSLSTVQNAIYSSELLENTHPEIEAVAIVSSDYHIPWGAVLFQTRFLLSAQAQQSLPIQVTTNAAFEANNQENYQVLSFQANGILELSGIQ